MAQRTASCLPPRDVLSRAAALLAAQPSVPASPGIRQDGGALLCAGAALAAAGLAADERAAFAADVTGVDGMRTLYGTIAALGWDRDFCHGMIRKNDRTAPAVRRSVMVAQLQAAMADAPV